MSPQNPSASSAARNGRMRAVPAAALLGLASIAVFAGSGLGAGAAAPTVALASLCFTCLLAPVIVLGMRPLDADARPRPGGRRAGALAIILIGVALAAYLLTSALDHRALAMLS